MATINAVIVEPDGTVRKAQIENDLGAFQAVVGGYITPVYGQDCTIYVNEEGMMMRLPVNESATLFAARFCGLGQVLLGTALIIGPPKEGSDTDVHENVVSFYELEQ